MQRRALCPMPVQPPPRHRAPGASQVSSILPCHVLQHIFLLNMPPAPCLTGSPHSPQMEGQRGQATRPPSKNQYETEPGFKPRSA